MMRQKWLCIILLTAVLVLGLAGCVEPAPEPTEDRGTELTICNIGTMDDATVERIRAHLESLLEERLGQPLTIHLKMLNQSSYSEQLNLMFLQGSAPDLFTIYRQVSFDNLVSSGYLLELDELLERFFTDSTLPSVLWNRCTVDGICYGVPTSYRSQQFVCYLLREDTAQEFGTDAEHLWNWDDLHELLLQIKEKYPDTYPILPHYGAVMDYLGQDSLGDNLGVLVDESSDSITVENWYASESYYDFCKQMHQWYQEGLVLTDAYDTQTYVYALIISGLGQGGIFRSVAAPLSGYVELRLSENMADTWMNDITWGVSSFCAEPELAVQVLNCMYTDPEIAKLLAFGEEGIDYSVDSDGSLLPFAEPTEQSSIGSYWKATSWAWPGIANLKDIIPNLEEHWVAFDEEQIRFSPAYGFAFDASGVATQIEQCQNVVEKYHKGLVCGFLDPDVYLPQFLEELEQAGISEIIMEKQRQLDLWLAE